MTAATIRRSSDIEVELDDGTEVTVTDYGEVDTDSVLAERRADGLIVVSYLAGDWDGGHDDPIADRDGEVELIRFDDGYERNDWIRENLQACANCEADESEHGKRIYDDCGEGNFTPTKWPALFKSGRAHWVERYEHGLVRYALTGESSVVDRQWDVASACAVLLLDGEWSGDLTEIARSILAEYTSWCNGDIWGVCHFVVDPATGETIEDEACWGFIGSEYAEETLKSEHAYWLEAT